MMAEDNYQLCIKKLKALREKVNWEVEKERHELLDQLYDSINSWDGKFPKFRDFFHPEEVNWIFIHYFLNMTNGSNKRMPLVNILENTGYKDEPKLDENGKPQSRRDTAVLCVATYIPRLFKIYDRFDVNYTDESGFTHFHAACMAGCDDVVVKFLKLGQDPDCLPREPNSSSAVDPPLHLAAKHKRNKVVEVLLQYGANPDLPDKDGSTAMHVICAIDELSDDDGSVGSVLYQITNGVFKTVLVDSRKKLGNAPLPLTLANEVRSLMKLLLDGGANPNLANKDGSTPLHTICDQKFDKGFVKLFFEVNDAETHTRSACQRVRVDARDVRGRTPLQLAVARLVPDVVKILLDHGADLSSFVFPDEAYFASSFGRNNDNSIGCESKLVFDVMNVVECLKNGGYELSLSDALQVMQFLARIEKIVKNNPSRKYKDVKNCALCAADDKVTLCLTHKSMELSKKFFQSWALECFLMLTYQRVPILGCERIIKKLSNEDLLRLCLAVRIDAKSSA